MKWWFALLPATLLGGCGDFPRDQSGTLARIRDTGEMRVGMIIPDGRYTYDPRLTRLVERAAADAGGRPAVTRGASEPLLLMLEQGELDMVVGEFDSASPWTARVHVIPPLGSRPHGPATIETTAALRNGENGWIMLVEREARALSE